MSENNVIDLVSNDDDNDDHSNIQNLSNEEKVKYSPSNLTLRNIGLSVIKMQYGNLNAHLPLKLNKSQLWTNFWLDAPMYNFRYLLDGKFNKNFKCKFSKSNHCTAVNKLSKLDFIHHVQRGHVRNRKKWRELIKRKKYIVEVVCTLCNKLKKEADWLNVKEFYSHMRKKHPGYPVYSNYQAFFNNCTICNVETKSLHENIVHRRICSKQLLENENHERNASFNDCFKNLIGYDFYFRNSDIPTNDFYERFSKVFVKKTLYGFCLSYNPKCKKDESTNGHVNKVIAPRSANNQPLIITNKHQPTNKANNQTKYIRISGPPQTTATSGTTVSIPKPTPNIITTDMKKPLSFMEIKTKFLEGIAQNKTSIKYSETITPNQFIEKTGSLGAKFMIPYYGSIDKGGESLQNSKNTIVYCELCNGMTKGNIHLYNHIRIAHPNAKFFDNECKACNKKFFTPEGFTKHFSDYSKTCPVARKCVFCAESVPVSEIYSHIYKFHQNEFSQVFEVNVCLICKNECKDGELAVHLACYHNMPDLFETIQKSNTNRPKLPDANLFNPPDQYNCPHCSSSFINELELRNHIILFDHRFICHYKCGFKTDKEYYLSQHVKSAHPHLTYCEICKRSFKEPIQKIHHFLQIHNKKAFVPIEYMS